MNTVDDTVRQRAILYYYSNGLFDLSNGIFYKKGNDEAWKIIADTTATLTPLPDELSLIHIPMANQYLHNLAIHELRKFSGPEVFADATGLSIDSLQSLIKDYGETYLALLLSKNYLPPYAHERYLANQLLSNIDKKNLLVAEAVREELTNHFPNSSFLMTCNQELDSNFRFQLSLKTC